MTVRRFAVPWFSLALTAITVTIEAATYFDHGLYSTLERHFATDWDAFARLELYRAVVSPFLQTNAGFMPTIIGLTTVAVPLFEFRAGSRRAILTFFAGDWLSTLPTLVVLRAAGALGSATAARLAISPDSGSSSGALACLAAFACALPFRLRLVALTGLAAVLIGRILLWHRLFDFQHLVAASAGVGLWFALASYRGAPRLVRAWARPD